MQVLKSRFPPALFFFFFFSLRPKRAFPNVVPLGGKESDVQRMLDDFLAEIHRDSKSSSSELKLSPSSVKFRVKRPYCSSDEEDDDVEVRANFKAQRRSAGKSEKVAVVPSGAREESDSESNDDSPKLLLEEDSEESDNFVQPSSRGSFRKVEAAKVESPRKPLSSSQEDNKYVGTSAT